MAEKKVRKMNWEKDASAVLVDKVVENIVILDSKLKGNVTAEKKAVIWQDVTQCVNAQSSVLRTQDEIKKKWQDLKSIFKKKERERRQHQTSTGSGPVCSIDLTEVEEKILSVVSDTAIDGIHKGIDTFVRDNDSTECIR